MLSEFSTQIHHHRTDEAHEIIPAIIYLSMEPSRELLSSALKRSNGANS